MDVSRKAYPSDVSDEEWALVAPYLTLLSEDCPQPSHSLREVFNGLRYVVKTGAPWRWTPNDPPPREIVYRQAQRWLKAGGLEALAEDLRAVLRLAAGRSERPGAAIVDSRTLRSTPESGGRAGYDGARRKKGSKLHLAVDTLGAVDSSDSGFAWSVIQGCLWGGGNGRFGSACVERRGLGADRSFDHRSS